MVFIAIEIGRHCNISSAAITDHLRNCSVQSAYRLARIDTFQSALDTPAGSRQFPGFPQHPFILFLFGLGNKIGPGVLLQRLIGCG